MLPDTYPGLASPQAEEGNKYDHGKPRMDLIPPEAIFASATVFAGGAEKYGDRNWEKGMGWGRIFGALNRHLWAWWGGRGPTSTNFALGELDPETKHSHMWHVLTCAMMLVAYEERRAGNDDRLTVDKAP